MLDSLMPLVSQLDAHNSVALELDLDQLLGVPPGCAHALFWSTAIPSPPVHLALHGVSPVTVHTSETWYGPVWKYACAEQQAVFAVAIQ